MTRQLSSSGDVHLIDFQYIEDDHGELVVMERNNHIPIPIERLFHVRGNRGVSRGHHAHYQCTQIMVCLSGKCRITWTDGQQQRELVLDCPQKGLFIPPNIWVDLLYEEENSTLLVLCDHPYEESDYIRNRDEFLAYRKEHKNK